MKTEYGRPLWRRLTCLYVVLAAVTALGMLVSKKYVSRGGPEDIEFVWRGLLIGLIPLFAGLCAFTFFRLLVPLRRTRNIGDEPERIRLAWERLARFPGELRLFHFGCGTAITTVYRLAARDWTFASPIPAGELARGISFDLSTFAALAFVHAAAARRLLRPYLRSLQWYRREESRGESAVNDLMAIAALGLVYEQIRLFVYAVVVFRDGEEPQPAVLLAIGAAVFGVSLAAVWLVSSMLFRDVDLLASRIRGNAGLPRRRLFERLPIISSHEPGALASAYNALQDRFEREYARYDRELQLAQRVQEQLLSPREGHIGLWRVATVCDRIEDVGGGFCDWTQTGDGRIALAAGRVVGDRLPAALVMSAILTLLRSGWRPDISAGERLTELGVALKELLAGGMCVHIAVAVIDPNRRIVEWSVAGEVSVAIEPSPAGADRKLEPESGPLGVQSAGLPTFSSVLVPSGRISIAVRTAERFAGERFEAQAVREGREPDGRAS